MTLNHDQKNLSKIIPSVDSTYQSIREILEKARSAVYRSINFAMVLAYWNIGKVIVEEEQQGKERAEYGKSLIKELSFRLTTEYGKGFDESNLRNIRQFYIIFPNCDALRHELTWTHYRLLLRIEKEETRNFYTLETVDNNWSTRELERQINSLLYERIALSKHKENALFPEIKFNENYFYVTFRQSEEYLKLAAREEPKEKLEFVLNERQRQSIEYVKSHKYITISEYISLNKVNDKTARRDLNYMVEMKLFVKEGSTTGLKFRLTSVNSGQLRSKSEEK